MLKNGLWEEFVEDGDTITAIKDLFEPFDHSISLVSDESFSIYCEIDGFNDYDYHINIQIEDKEKAYAFYSEAVSELGV